MFLLQVAAETTNAWGIFFGAVGAAGTSFMLAQVKKSESAVARNPFFRKIQPALTLGGALLAPWVASQLSSGVDISGLGAAPMATLGTVLAAELLAMLKRST